MVVDIDGGLQYDNDNDDASEAFVTASRANAPPS